LATCLTDASALEILLIEALTASDRLEYEQVGAHLATALDALRRETRRSVLSEATLPLTSGMGWFD
jgi:hypothetical protein